MGGKRPLNWGISGGDGDGIFRTLSRTFSRQDDDGAADYDSSSEPSLKPISKAEDWKLMPVVRAAQKQSEKDHTKGARLGVTWRDLTIRGVGSDAAISENVISQFNVLQLIKEARRSKRLRTIVENSHGCVKPGEMLLVLGRPGSGCTSLLKILSNRRIGYAQVEGDVKFGSMNAEEAKQYRGQIVINTEEELYFPTLTVGQTMDFATRLKIPAHYPSNFKSRKECQQALRDFLLESMGIEHTSDTKIGNEFIRGISGGERKRVSIIETLVARGSIICWDNSTRGLDANNALEYTRAIRALTDVLGIASIVTLYQAGNGIYELFDKVLVIDEGKQLYYGPMMAAKPFMENLGFAYTPGANIADYLTGVCVPTERKIKPGYETIYPRTADAIRAAYDRSEVKALMDKESDYPETDLAKQQTEDFRLHVQAEKSRSLPKHSPLTVSFYTQTKAAVIRQYQLLWGDKATLIIKQGSGLIQSLLAGSLFYNAPNDSTGLFLKSGAVFFSLLYNSLMAMSEVTDSFSARPVLAKHRGFAFYHPAAFCIAQVAADLPILIFQITIFALPVYWMSNLKPTAEAFFTFWVLIYAVTMCMTALFRAIGAMFSTFDGASKMSGLFILLTAMYTGYMIPRPQFHPWLGWIYWINPIAYGFEALIANEMHNQYIPCVKNNLAPVGPWYTDPRHQACTGVVGASLGATSLTGDDYLHGLKYSHSHVWRNFGIIWAWWALFICLTIVFTSRWKQTAGNSGFLLVPREKADTTQFLIDDEEVQRPEFTSSEQISYAEKERDIDDQLIRNTSVFTWKNLSYTVKTRSGDRVLLDDVQGWVNPGMLGALMGASGAGKTTLLDVLAQRKTEGTIKGSILVDGRPLPISFQRSAGYCEQLDVHEPLATVREALEFSALLRQNRNTPKEEKLKYVDVILDLLEMHDIENTLIGITTAGLSVEQRKRLTIGVELVSKPSILIFLDEPTSGLDGQAAFNTVRFLRKLADVGQAVLVTIHQPSASLFAQFDTLLLLAKGGKTVYFGDVGENASTLKEYFGRHGAPCPEDVNPAEHMIDVVSGSLSQGRDWNQVWLESPEYAATSKELDRIIGEAASRPAGTLDDGHEFATTLWEQTKLVTKRMNISLYRNTDYANNKFALHIISALTNGFSFWMIGDSLSDLQQRMFTIFVFVFVAPGVIAQLQPLFIGRRDIFEVRERKSKMYHWSPFVTGLIVSEFPYLVVCAILYFVTWYYTVGFPSDSDKAGAVFFVVFLYEFVYTGIGQAIAAYAPNEVFASLVNPLVIGVLVSYCGVFVPYAQITAFWRYWLYWINPFNYIMGSLLTFTSFSGKVKCRPEEYAIFNPPQSQTCAEYLAPYLKTFGSRSNLTNPDATSGCMVCQYRSGADYLYMINLKDYYYGWRDAAVVALFALSSYGCVYLLMKLRTKASKKAE